MPTGHWPGPVIDDILPHITSHCTITRLPYGPKLDFLVYKIPGAIFVYYRDFMVLTFINVPFDSHYNRNLIIISIPRGQNHFRQNEAANILRLMAVQYLIYSFS